VSLGEYSLSVLGIVGAEGTEYPRLDIGTQENPSPLVFLKNINGAL
jgi:hypothetical protein